MVRLLSSPSSSLLALVFLLSLLPLLTLSIPLQTVEELTPVTPRTLVLSTSPAAVRANHSILLSSLAAREHVLTHAHLYDEHVRLVRHDVALYDNILLFLTAVDDFSDSLPLDALLRWVDDGHNLVLVLGEDGVVSEPVRLLLHELGVVAGEDKEFVVDHFHVDLLRDRSARDGGQHSYITTTQLIDAEVITGIKSGKQTPPILYHGLPHSFALASSTQSSHLYIPILRAEPTAVGSGDAAPLLMSAYQTRSNTRVLFVGHPSLLSNAFISASLPASTAASSRPSSAQHYVKSGNGQLVETVLAWAFRERGVLRARNLLHHQVDGADLNPHSYRVSDYTAFSIVIEEWDGVSHSWQPFLASDVPLSFVMIDPYIRHALTPHANGSYSTSFQVPDVYGVYKYVVQYSRVGYSPLTASQQVSVTPYRHDQYARFLFVAYPYYVSAFTLMAAFILFGWLFLYVKDEPAVEAAGVKRVVVERKTVVETEIKKG